MIILKAESEIQMINVAQDPEIGQIRDIEAETVIQKREIDVSEDPVVQMVKKLNVMRRIHVNGNMICILRIQHQEVDMA
jgi:hypothetical protein